MKEHSTPAIERTFGASHIGAASAELLSQQRGNVLIVSPHFPPSTLAGVHRARHLAKYLPHFGWRPIIIRADERHYPEAPDLALARLVPDSVLQIRTGAVPASLARFAGIGDIGLRALAPVARAISDGVTQFAPRAILITGSPYYPMLLAGWVRRRFAIPVVLDFQDPWVSVGGAQRRRLTKGWLSHRLGVVLEPKAVRAASWITSVSNTQNQEMAARYPWLDACRMTAIPIGGDPDDFVAMRVSPLADPSLRLEEDRINICYVGTFLPRAGPVVRALFDAAARVRGEHPDLGTRLRFVFVGTSNQPAGAAASGTTHLVAPIAEDAGVGDLVREYAPRVPFLEALSILSNADGLLLLGSDEAHYTASKIYPALMSGRPWLSIFHRQSSAHDILTRAGGGAAFAFSNTADLTSMVSAIADGLARLASAPASLGSVDSVAYAQFTARAVAGRFADVFQKSVA
jgi:glycosyltransferase involved in cell wall biosynthesis